VVDDSVVLLPLYCHWASVDFGKRWLVIIKPGAGGLKKEEPPTRGR